jgi:DNA-binding phage protein
MEITDKQGLDFIYYLGGKISAPHDSLLNGSYIDYTHAVKPGDKIGAGIFSENAGPGVYIDNVKNTVTVNYGGTTYVIKTTGKKPNKDTSLTGDSAIFKHSFDLNTIIAFAKTMGKSNEDIVKALKDAGIYKSDKDGKPVPWTEQDVIDANTTTTDVSKRVHDFLIRNGYANPNVITVLNDDGKTYSYAIEYIDANNIRQKVMLPDITKDITDAELSKILESNDIAPYVKAPGGVVTGTGVTAQQAADYNVLADKWSSFADQMGIPTAKSDYNITPEQYAELKVKFPDYSDQEILNAIAQSGWTADLLNGPNFKSDTMEYRSLAEREGIAQEAVNIAQDKANTLTQSAAQTALNNIIRDSSLLQSLEAQRAKDAAAGTIAGAQAANAALLTDEAKANYLEQANEILKATEGLSDQMREQVLKEYATQLDNYTSAQLNEAALQEQFRANDLAELAVSADLIRSGVDYDISRAQRDVNEEISRVTDKANSIATGVSAEAGAQRAAADADLASILAKSESLRNLEPYAGSVDNMANVVNPTVGYGTNYGTGTIVKPEYIDVKENQIDETLLQGLKDSGLVDTVLSQSTYDYATKKPTRSDIITQYDLDYLNSYKDTEDKFKGYAQEANRVANRTFNQTQQAYLAAIAAGDIKTAKVLTDLAQSAGVGKQNVYNTSALTSALNRQQQNANVGNTMQTNYLNQIANNAAALNQAKTDADVFHNKYNTFDVNNPNANTIGNVVTQAGVNAAEGSRIYAGIYNTGMGGQSAWNDLVSKGNTTTNEERNKLANDLTGINSFNAQNNTTNSSTLNQEKQLLKDEAERLKAIANGTLKLP